MHCGPLLFLTTTLVWCRAEVTLPALFSDHAVLQASKEVRIWGKGSPDEAVMVSINDAKASVTTGADGKWSLVLDLSSATGGPYDLVVVGKNRLTVRDVYVGEVWLCSGQSNMEQELRNTLPAEELSATDSAPTLRQFLVPQKGSPQPEDDCKGRWIVAAPDTIGRFTAVGFHFARYLQAGLGPRTPVGIINASYGGSCIESWLPQETLKNSPELADSSARYRDCACGYEQKMGEFVKKWKEWTAEAQRDDQSVNSPKFSEDANWKTITLPATTAALGAANGGVIWLKRTVEIKPAQAGIWYSIRLGTIHGFEQVYWNGTKVGETMPGRSNTINDFRGKETERHYDVPGRLVQPGIAEITVRIFFPVGSNGIEEPVWTQLDGTLFRDSWQYHIELEYSPLDASLQAALPVMPSTPMQVRFLPSYLYNAMICPLLPATMRGVVWYQGEANIRRADQYARTFPLLFSSWREAWNTPSMPFLYCQLPSYLAKDNVPSSSQWAEVREAQTKATMIANTSQAILIDLGEAFEIHYKNKKDVGERLSRLALADVYKKEIVAHGPVFKQYTLDGSRVIVEFDHIDDGGLVAKPLDPKIPRHSPIGDVEGFTITGDNETWIWANARIQGDHVEVWSKKISKPLAIRYGWANNPTANLYNAAGLPAAPFRTDTLPLSTAGKSY